MEDRYLFKAKDCNSIWRAGLLIALREDRCAIEEKDGSKWACDSKTICQCTGLKDKNGKLIWDNDIVKHDFCEYQIGVQLAIVKYDSKYACYQIKPIYDWMYCDKSDCEVIGNIFDNPELLEVGE